MSFYGIFFAFFHARMGGALLGNFVSPKRVGIGGRNVIWIIVTICAYLGFNVAVWLAIGHGGMVALGVANVLGGLMTALYFRKEMKGAPKLHISALGAVGIVLIVLGLRWSHSVLPVTLSMEAVYNLFAIVTWPTFVLLHYIWPKKYQEEPGWFDLGCHAAMFLLVVARFATYGDVELTLATLAAVGTAILGYLWFNLSIRAAATLPEKQRRPTNVTMNVLAGITLITLAMFYDAPSMVASGRNLTGLALGGISILGIVAALGSAYAHFGKLKLPSLVAPLVYDGILVASPILMVLTGETNSLSGWTVLVAAGMLAVTVVRYRYHRR